MAGELPATRHTEIFHARHCTYNLHVHLVFVVKYRKKIFTAEILKDLKIIFETICLELDADLIEFDGEQDHVHLLILYPHAHTLKPEPQKNENFLGSMSEK